MADLCYGCRDVVEGTKVVALEKIWHPEHFLCSECKTAITEDSCFEINGAPVCEEDFIRFLPTCAYCNQPVTDKFVMAMDRAWHPDHFMCAKCESPLHGKMFYEKEGRSYCHEDYQRYFAPYCHGCGMSINGSALVAMEKSWHQDCFKCANCSGQIAGESFKLLAGKPACNTCLPVQNATHKP